MCVSFLKCLGITNVCLKVDLVHWAAPEWHCNLQGYMLQCFCKYSLCVRQSHPEKEGTTHPIFTVCIFRSGTMHAPFESRELPSPFTSSLLIHSLPSPLLPILHLIPSFSSPLLSPLLSPCLPSPSIPLFLASPLFPQFCYLKTIPFKPTVTDPRAFHSQRKHLKSNSNILCWSTAADGMSLTHGLSRTDHIHCTDSCPIFFSKEALCNDRLVFQLRLVA